MKLTYLYLFLYLVSIGLITWHSSRGESHSDYMNRSKQLSSWEMTWTTFASLLTGYNFVLGVTFAYLYGFWYLLGFFGAGLAFFVLYSLYRKQLMGLQSGYNLFSAGDFFGIRYGVSSKIIVNVILCVALFLFLTLQIFINTRLFSILLEFDKLTTLLLTTGVVCVYLWIGGFKTSVRTDIFQGFLMLPIVLAVLLFPFHLTFRKLPEAFDPGQLGFALGLGVLQFLSLLAQPESFQRIFAAKNALALRKGLTSSFILIMLVAGSMAYLGINFRFAGTNIDPSNLFIDGILAELPHWLSSLLLVSLIAAFMGTIDSSAFSLGVLLTPARCRSSASAVNQTRYFMLLGIVGAALASVFLFSFLGSVFALISLISIVGTALLLSLAPAKIDSVDITSFLLAGSATYLAGLILGWVTDNPLTSLLPSLTGVLGLLAVRAYRKLC
jgi:Na+/proline symporter